MRHRFNFGQLVYIKTDPEQMPVQIIAIRFHMGGTVTYTTGCNGTYQDIYEDELTAEIDTLKKLQ
jgi:hypothetical protein